MSFASAIALQSNDFTSIEATREVFTSLHQVLKVFHDHARQEDHFILPAIQKYSAELVNQFTNEHLTGASLTGRLSNLMTIYSRAAGEDAKQETGENLCKAFSEFVAFNLYHMNKEEEKINKELWSKYSDEEIVCLHNAIVSDTSPDILILEATWILRAISNREIIEWIVCIKNGASCKVFDALLQLAESKLPADRWNKVLEGLCEGAMVA